MTPDMAFYDPAEFMNRVDKLLADKCTPKHATHARRVVDHGVVEERRMLSNAQGIMAKEHAARIQWYESVADKLRARETSGDGVRKP